MSERTGGAQRQIPAKLVAEGFTKGLLRENGGDRMGRELDAIAAVGDAVAQLVVVAEKVYQRGKATDPGEARLSGGHRRSQGKIDIAELPGGKHAGVEIAGDADGFQVGGKRRRGQPAVKAGHQADRWVLERKADGTQVIGFHADVAIADDQEVVAGVFRQADQLIHLLAGAELLAAGKEANRNRRKITYDFLDYGNGRVAVVGYVE